MTQSQSIIVDLGPQSYTIFVGSNWWDQLPATIHRTLPDATHAMLVVDSEIRGQWGDRLGAGLRDGGWRVDPVEIPSGESSKSVQQLEKLWEQMRLDRTDRHSIVVAVGGGVVGDLAGFAAATFNRGVRFVQVPTTLLAQVDSSVGGKTGINLPDAKNVVGSFWQPSLVVIDTAVLSTLPPRALHSGLAEVAKYGIIADATFFRWLEANHSALLSRQPAALEHAILTSCKIKAQVVGEDEREVSGKRAILNYGHTFAHAIEATAGYWNFLHGEAVSIGMQMAAELARRLGRVDEAFVERQGRLLRDLQLPIAWDEAEAEAMLDVMRSDKKVAHGRVRFVLPTRLGHVELVNDVPVALVRDAIEACRH